MPSLERLVRNTFRMFVKHPLLDTSSPIALW